MRAAIIRVILNLMLQFLKQLNPEEEKEYKRRVWMLSFVY